VNISAYSSAAWGMADAARRFDAAAENIANGSADLPADLVQGTMLAPAQQALNATMFRVADETHKSLIDVLA
jgi:hypothetical protein